MECRYIVECAREIGIPDIIDRCNLTVLLEPGQEGLVDFLARHRVRVAASLPCYSAANVDEQRGGGVFGRSIKARLSHVYATAWACLQLILYLRM